MKVPYMICDKTISLYCEREIIDVKKNEFFLFWYVIVMELYIYHILVRTTHMDSNKLMQVQKTSPWVFLK
jgi:hypothetical protein